MEGTCINNKIFVRFDKDHNKVVAKGLNGIDIIRPDAWLHKETTEEGETSKFQENVNGLETKPQVCEVLTANPKYPYPVHTIAFCHYMAFETAQNGDLVTYEGFIDADYVIFTILPDGSYKMAENMYLGERVIIEDEVTPSGIIFNWNKDKPKPSQIKLTHVCGGQSKKSLFEYGELKAGMTVLTIDNYQYEFTHNKRKHVMLREHEIVAIID